jgi:two-component system response regulator YesN
MYKLLIVDDEALVREAIKEQMNWAELGYECIGDCEDGVEALEFVKCHKPDVVLTDIGMPFMNGMELTLELSVHYPSVKVIILTGYDDFDYAQQALKLQAVDYILKPITAAELETVLRKLSGEMDAENRHNQDYEQLRRQLTESLPLLKERFLERMVTSPLTDKQRELSFSYYRLEWEGPWLIELAIDADEFALDLPSTLSDQQLIQFAVFNIAQEIAAKYKGTAIFRDRENRVIALLSAEDPDELQERAMLVADEIHAAVSAYLPIVISIGISHVGRLTDNSLSLVHQSALSALDYRYVIGSNTIIRITDMEQRKRPELLSVVTWESELITKLKTGTPQEMDEWIAKLFGVFREHVFPIDVCHIYLQRIVLTLMHTLYEMDSNSSRMFGANNPITEINLLPTLDEIEVWMKQLCSQAVSVIKSMRDDQSVLQIEKAMEYVRQHYKDPELSLKSVCKHVSMSSSYFSSIFKQNMGRTFVEFVTQERMEKAKELLHLTAMKSYEIAYAVGYSDPHYFSGAFKKHTGDTPTDYRHKMTSGKV